MVQQPAIATSKGAIPKTTNLQKVNTVSNELKIQTGIDRYFQRSKRKLSPKSSKIQPTPKQTRNLDPEQTVSQNRFSLLATNEVDDEDTEPIKKYINRHQYIYVNKIPIP